MIQNVNVLMKLSKIVNTTDKTFYESRVFINVKETSADGLNIGGFRLNEMSAEFVRKQADALHVDIWPS